MAARTYHKLSAAKVNAIRAAGHPGMYSDGDNLFLQVAKGGTASWLFKFMFGGKRHEMGLGSARAGHVGLKEARELADEARALKRRNVDPLQAKRAQKLNAALTSAKKTPTFEACARQYIIDKQAGWRSDHHKQQWRNSLERYAFPILGKVAVDAIDLGLIRQVLDPIWHSKTETASRVRGRIEVILDWAATNNYRSGENPARWKGHLENLLQPRSKVQKVVHHRALPYSEMAGFMADLRALDGSDAAALELAILCGLRSKEVLKAPWDEISDSDLARGLWVIPAERMKAERDHRVALSARAVEIIEQQKAIRSGPYVFGTGNKPAATNTLEKVIKQRLGRGAMVTPHGFRSTFRDWVAECTNFPSEVAEMALAHAVGDKVEAAYRRGDLFAKRLALAEAWARYCRGEDTSAEVIPISAAARSA